MKNSIHAQYNIQIFSKEEVTVYYFSDLRKETLQDFSEFLFSYTDEEHVMLLQTLKELPSLKDAYFGKLEGLPALDKFTADKEKATPAMPLKPSTFNEV